MHLIERNKAIDSLRAVRGIGKSTAAVLYDEYKIDGPHKLAAALVDPKSVEKLVNDDKIKASENTIKEWLADLMKGKQMSNGIDPKLKQAEADNESAEAAAKAAEAAAKAEAEATEAAVKADAEAAETEEVRKAKGVYIIADGHSITSKGRIYGPGKKVQRTDVCGTDKDFERLLGKGVLK